MVKQQHSSLRSLTSVALLALLLLLGFCPLRNSLTAWLSPNNHVTRTNGAHLLTADDCHVRSLAQTPVPKKKQFGSAFGRRCKHPVVSWHDNIQAASFCVSGCKCQVCNSCAGLCAMPGLADLRSE